MTELEVLIDGVVVGGVTQGQSGALSFDYDERYRTSRSATPLSLSMPLTTRSHQNAVIAAFMWGLLPDNSDVLRRWGREFGVSPSNPFALLSAVGQDCAGAVQFIRPEDLRLSRDDGVEWLTEAEIAEKIRELRRAPTAWQVADRGGQFSLAGAQAKTALHYADGRWGVPSGSVPTTHIIKPAIERFDDHDLNEHLCLRVATELGLTATRSRIRSFVGERAVVMLRYDRVERSGNWHRVHQEDMCQALGLPPSLKYQQDGGPAPERIVRLLRAVSPAREADDNINRFVDGLVFNWLIAGTDAHAKNYSVLLRARQVRLAPLYDVASILQYDIDAKKLKMPMKIGGAYRLGEIGRRNWESFAIGSDLEPELVVARAAELAESLPVSVRRATADDNVCRLNSALPARLVDVLSTRARQCAARLRAQSNRNTREYADPAWAPAERLSRVSWKFEVAVPRLTPALR